MFSDNFIKVLNKLKVTENLLSDTEKKNLDAKGFIILENYLSTDLTKKILNNIEDIFEEEGPAAGIQKQNNSVNLDRYGQEEGVRRLCDLVNKGEIFKKIYLDKKLLSAVAYVLKRDFKLSSLNARDVLKGKGYQSLHADWKLDYDGNFHVFNSIWILDDFSEKNGSTRIVPSTHLRNPPNNLVPDYVHPEEQNIVVPKGSVIFMNAHLWHGGQENQTGQHRRAIHAYYTAYEHMQQTSQFEHLKYKTWLKLDESSKIILGIEEN